MIWNDFISLGVWQTPCFDGLDFFIVLFYLLNAVCSSCVCLEVHKLHCSRPMTAFADNLCSSVDYSIGDSWTIDSCEQFLEERLRYYGQDVFRLYRSNKFQRKLQFSQSLEKIFQARNFLQFFF